LYQTRRRVLILDRFASGLITVVGLSVILAVFGMMLFLFSSSWPLFKLETFKPAGHLNASSQTAGRLLIDETAPLAFLLPGKEEAICAVTARLIESPRSGRDSSAEAAALEKAKYEFAAAESTSAPAASWIFQRSHLTPQATQATQLAPRCVGQDGAHVLLRMGDSLQRVQFQIVRQFLSSEEQRMLDIKTRALLNERRWAVAGSDVLVKSSQQSPLAKLSLQSETVWSIPDFYKTYPQQTLSSVRFVPRPGKKDGLLILGSHRPSTQKSNTQNEATAELKILSLSENQITGEKTSSLRALQFKEPVHFDLDRLQPTWIENRYLVIASQNNHFFSVDSEDAQLSTTVLTLPQEFGPLNRFVPAFGGAAAFAEFAWKEPRASDSPNVKCASLDVGRATRAAQNAADRQAAIPVLWEDKCVSSDRLEMHPHKRVVYRWLKQSNASDQNKSLTPNSRENLNFANETLEARELTTGRIAATTLVPTNSFAMGVVDTQGQFFGWPDENKNLNLIEFIAPHVEVSIKSLFEKIRYESYENASYSWQSTSGSDEFQAKFSLIPLIWGTVKATLYSLLFAVPLAIFAAVYSSEILDRQTRNIVKPTLEMMASVPSVVLGFLAAIVIAPWVESHVVSVLLIGTSMPFLLYIFGVFLQTPSARHLTTRGLYASRRLLLWVIAGFAAMLWLLARAGMWIERTAFGGDLKAFLSGGPGTEGVLWGLLILPLVFISLWSVPVRRARNWYRIGVFVLGPIAAIGIGSVLSGHTTLRNDLLGQYAQRNTLVISIAMGFAIIPIIYSLAEDALTSVPNSLRAGSLACGASVWQTTAWVVLPTAASGLFSAVMVGLGRGIGETMIAVMATGNSAVMTINPFDGLRSMAANIAVELPEAAQASTHYRILFLSALTLFLFTFTLNSFAELLRARYRERNKAL